jgi:tetratricopeptide (TPR) repeat protein
MALPVREAEAWELRAALFEGGALAALGRREEAQAFFDTLVARLEAGLGRRSDLFPRVLEDPRRRALGSAGATAGGGEETIDRQHLAALAHLWRAYLLLGRDEARCLTELRAAHVSFLESRVIALRTGASDPGGLEALLERDLSPYGLILFNERLAPEGRDATLLEALALSHAFGRVAPLELQGLAAPDASTAPLGNLFRDPERLAQLLALREATLGELQRQLDELADPAFVLGDFDARDRERLIGARTVQLMQAENEERRLLAKKPPPPPERVYLQLLEYLSPSMHAHTLAGQLRGEGRAQEALDLCARALQTLRTAPLGASSSWNELSAARFELLRGSVLMDESRAAEAEEAYLASETRLASLEAQVEEWIQSAPDPEGMRLYRNQVRHLRGEALLALAVNANVRQGDAAKALAYFERAYELNQTPFMRILRACYRARSGKRDEARTVLASVVPVPSLYYNIACTHALLGEKEQALDYLERDVRENCPSPGSLAQKQSWAAKDPDLAGLRGEPRFERLLGNR